MQKVKLFCISFFLMSAISSCAHLPKELAVEYIDNPCLEPMQDYLYSTCANMRIMVSGKMYLIPRGFKTDLASIPRCLWSFWSPHNTRYVASAIMHDYMYSCDESTNRLDADNVFYYSLIEHGVPKKTAYPFWVALRAFGWLSYKEGDTCTERFVDIRIPYKSAGL